MIFSVRYTKHEHYTNYHYPMEVSNIKCKLRHYISSMIICESYKHKFSVSKDMKFFLTMIKGVGTW